MKPREILATVASVIILCLAVKGILIAISHMGSHPAESLVMTDEAPAPSETAAPLYVTPPIPTPAPLPGVAPQTMVPEPIDTPEAITPQLPPRAQLPPPAVPPARQQRPDAQVREVLVLVGIDAGAEEFWIASINDPNLPANARRNLIEDLNETGFADPRNLTADDLPMIVARLQLLEDLAVDPLDEVNAAAIDEAYKDLVNMYNRLAGL